MDIRSSDINDTTEIYDLQIKCFEHFDIMYKHNIEMLAATGIVAIENNKIIGFLLQTQMFACSELSSNTGMETSYLSNSSFFEIEQLLSSFSTSYFHAVGWHQLTNWRHLF